MAKRAEIDPKTNPAGKAYYAGKVGIFGRKYISPAPDPSHANRIRARKSAAPSWAKKAMPK